VSSHPDPDARPTGRGQPAGPIWLRPEPGSRRPRYSRQQIAQTALAIADTEGIQAVTMRRLAAELGAGTMTLYHYVRSKTDLVALMEDAIMGELLVPDDQLPTDWRQALTAIASRTRATFRHHPWALTGMRGTGLSPHALRHFEQSLAAVAGTGLDPAARLELIATVDDYVAGFVLKSDLEPALEAIPADLARAAADHLDEQLATGHYPHTQALLGTGDRLAALARLAAASSNDQRFERGLARLLDGVALHLPRRRASDTSDRARQHRT
jgi:AcrR family transcriptional regulator